MDISLLDKSKDKRIMSFLIKKATPYYLNSLRRYMINKVPSMAIEDVEFKANESVLYDEMVAHRLGLVPLKTDLRSYTLRSACSCEGKGCAKCELKLTLKAKGPGMVYASQLKSKDPKVIPVFPETPLVILGKNQSIELAATAILGFGKEHIKWSPCTVFYRHKPIITINDHKIKDAAAIAKSCPVPLFDVKAGKLKLNLDTYLKYPEPDAFFEQFGDAITIEYSPDEFVFTIECWGQLDADKIVKEAVSVFDATLDEFDTKLSELK